MSASPSYAVDFATVAQRDLQDIVEFIAADDAVAARRVLDLMESRVAALKRMPERGRVVPELAALGVHMYRELVVAPWRIIYRISGQTVYVLAVLDGRRNLEDVLLERLVR
ncbi:MAG: type II toxin-antitoxin system RelE/ParE family toxin [Kiritimatiellaeota bacterium]|nr:type II toxin-antitoxin system RelE/ParE family toxin [Kiritimatiellota bacterium]